jgi:putative FmdB family regulatory protein
MRFEFEHQQAITAEPLSECPKCKGKIRRLIGAGTGFILKGSKQTGLVAVETSAAENLYAGMRLPRFCTL